jgi:hypothetical protein
MSGEPSAPTFRAMLVGIVIVIIAMMLVCALGDVLKIAGSPFLFIPGALGMVQTVGPEDVRTVQMADSPTIVRLMQPGLYAVYIDDTDLLAITDSLINANGNPWLKVKALDNGEKIPAALIDRGLRLYDTPYARGRPVVNFAITRPGAYELTHPRRNITMSIVPDYSTGRETLFTLIYLVQIALVAGIVVFFWRRRTRTEREAGKTEREAWIKRANAYWEKHAAQQRAEQKKRDSK